ncbi:MAG: hypothetical protein U1B80_02075 [Anaerolineaceae bacterium]|nr:hypothetical protein [Anaerolineaceae bacterium]
MMGGYWQSDNYFQGRAVEPGLRISIEEANQRADQFLTAFGSGLKITEIMEFSNNFYVVVEEEGTGKAAFELLIDPDTGSVYPEPGPNMMWNQKYGHMAYDRGDLGENQILVENARQLAQEYLDAVLPSAQVEADGFSFYGYYTFDYTVDGKIAGMLSVHAFGGQVWLHTWHGEFIQEMEME